MSDSEAGASHISDEEVFKRKLMMDGDRIDDDQRIDTLFSSFIQWCDAQGQRGEEVADGYERLLVQLDYLKFSSQKSAERQRASTREIEEMDKILTDMENEVVEVKKNITERHLELEEAKKARLNKMNFCHCILNLTIQQEKAIETLNVAMQRRHVNGGTQICGLFLTLANNSICPRVEYLTFLKRLIDQGRVLKFPFVWIS
ncbi:unnamed protein product [Larinioides sclopetarius]|uniref:THO complex subunit 7 n=1 Tax=Larinioides sclopetarius TaxID=280406 RepID=A0AAV1YX07_9ARAC